MSTPSRLSALSDSLDKLSLRERVFLLIFTLMFVGTGLYFVLNTWVQARALTLGQISSLREGIKEVKASEARFREVLSQRKAYEDLLKSNKIDLGKVMERYTKNTNIAINDFKEKRRVLSDQFGNKAKSAKVVVAYTQEVSINNASLEELSSFLEKLERERAPVRVTSVSLRTSSQDRQQLRFIKLGVTTYKSEVEQ